jgi:hypothetical protein
MSMSTRSTRAKREALEDRGLLLDLLDSCPDLFAIEVLGRVALTPGGGQVWGGSGTWTILDQLT